MLKHFSVPQQAPIMTGMTPFRSFVSCIVIFALSVAFVSAVDKDTFNPKDHTNWGTYHDPKNVFCGEFDCYRILGFDYESFGRSPPSTKEITQRYRSLGREWHPDKSKHKHAKDRFVVSVVVKKLRFPCFGIWLLTLGKYIKENCQSL